MSRARDILRIPTVRDASARTIEAIVDVLRQQVGRATSLVVLPLLVQPTSISASAAPGTRLQGSAHLLEVPDALLQQFRLIVEGNGDGITLELRDVTLDLVLASVALPATTDVIGGAWATTPIAAPLEHEVEVRVVGTGTAVLYGLTAQARTVIAPAR